MNDIDVTALVACECRHWYSMFEKSSIKTCFIPVEERFLNYLKSDGVVLPKSSLVHSFRKDELSDDEDAVSVDGESVLEEDFSELSHALRNAISQFGGKAFIKLNWSAPSDASWMNAGSLSCMTNGDAFLLLKSSSKVRQYCYHVYTLNIVKITNDIELLELCRSRNVSVDACITVKKWANLHLSMEFRVFVVDGKLRGANKMTFSAS